MPVHQLEIFVLKLCSEVERGSVTDRDRAAFFRAVRDLASKPLIRAARREAGLATFERTQRRCVHPNGVHPKLAYTVEGTPEYNQRLALIERAEGLYQRMRMECGISIS